MHSIHVKVKSEVLRQLNNIKIDAQEVKNLVDFGNPTEKAILEDFTAKNLEANGVFDLVSNLEDEIKTLKMLLNLLK
jgi:hypothetical protein|tara:strand:+ start:64 stop:294 length:231 start_codon:yes stop_codon:yes gene_type:complete